jgi:hypothetical protein
VKGTEMGIHFKISFWGSCGGLGLLDGATNVFGGVWGESKWCCGGELGWNNLKELSKKTFHNLTFGKICRRESLKNISNYILWRNKRRGWSSRWLNFNQLVISL